MAHALIVVACIAAACFVLYLGFAALVLRRVGKLASNVSKDVTTTFRKEFK